MEETLREVQKIQDNLLGILGEMQSWSFEPHHMHEADERILDRQLAGCLEQVDLIQAELNLLRSRLCVPA